MNNVLIAQLSRGYISTRHQDNLEALIRAFKEAGMSPIFWRATGATMVCQGRSVIATKFLRREDCADCDVLLWLDDDQVDLDCPAIVEMCSEASARQAIVGAAVSQRKPLGEFNTRFGPGQFTFFEGGELIQVASVGTGVCAVSHRAVAKVAEGMPQLRTNLSSSETVVPIYSRLVRDGFWYGEDTSFCVRAGELGVPVYLDTRVRVGHLGDYAYHLEDTSSSVPRAKHLTVNVEGH